MSHDSCMNIKPHNKYWKKMQREIEISNYNYIVDEEGISE